MIKKIFFFLLSSSILLKISAQNPLDIIAIANDGFLITSDTGKVIIDGIFAKGNVNTAYPSDDIITKEISAEAPFDSIDFILNTHYHADHIKAEYIVEHMVHGLTSILICPQQSYELIAATNSFENVKNRVLSINPPTGVSVDTNIKGWDFKILKLIHHNDDKNQHQANAYIFSINNIRIFHPGDGGINNLDELQALNLDKDSIDIAFIPYWIIGDDFETIGRQVINYLNPKIIIVMHVWVNQVEYYKNRVNELTNVPPVYYLDKSLDILSINKTDDSLKVTYSSASNSIYNNLGGFKIFPNPSNGELYIENMNNPFNKLSAEIYNNQGAMLLCQETENSKLLKIDIGYYPKGLYFIRINTNNQFYSKEIIIN